MPSLTVENYLKAIYQISIRNETEWVSTGRVADVLDVSAGSVTSMMKTLAESKFAIHKPYSGVRLTAEGRAVAVRMLRRHRLIELFLQKTLDLGWEQVHEEAEHLEHAVSDRLIDRIDEFLGFPKRDPHGDPIPSADGEMRDATRTAVVPTDCQPGTRIRVVRVTNQSSEFLRFLSDAGLHVGREGTITMNCAESGILRVAFDDDKDLTLGHTAANHLLVEPCAVED